MTENGNVTVTLTLNSQAADDIMGVLKDLANILNIAPPNGYQIIERTTTPPSQKLGLFRIKGKDGGKMTILIYEPIKIKRLHSQQLLFYFIF